MKDARDNFFVISTFSLSNYHAGNEDGSRSPDGGGGMRRSAEEEVDSRRRGERGSNSGGLKKQLFIDSN